MASRCLQLHTFCSTFKNAQRNRSRLKSKLCQCLKTVHTVMRFVPFACASCQSAIHGCCTVGHVFHRRCLHQLHYHRRNLTGSVHCPMCRAVVPTMKLAPSEDSHEGAKSKLSLWDLHADLKELQERRRMLECNIINVRCCSSLVIVLWTIFKCHHETVWFGNHFDDATVTPPASETPSAHFVLLPKDVVWGPGGWRSGCRFVDMTTVALDLPTFLSSLTSELNQLHGSVSIVHHTHLSKHRGVSVCHSKCPTCDSWWTRQLIQPLLFVTASAPLHAYPPVTCQGVEWVKVRCRPRCCSDSGVQLFRWLESAILGTLQLGAYLFLSLS